MLDIPPAIVRAYQEAAAREDVPVEQRPHYVRWLRYYLDFCHKYDRDPQVAESLRRFEDKLIEKHQGDWKRQQVRRAVTRQRLEWRAGEVELEASAGAASGNLVPSAGRRWSIGAGSASCRCLVREST